MTPEWEHLQRERDRLQELLTDLRMAERDEEVLVRDGERITGELADVATARAELEPLRRELAGYAGSWRSCSGPTSPIERKGGVRR